MSFPDVLAPLRAGVELLLTTLHSLVAVVAPDPAAGTTWLLAVAALVVVVRAAMLPLAVAQLRTSRRMRVLAPELARIRERFRGRTDAAARQRLARETADLYRSHGVRPAATLLPLLVQVPVFLALVQSLEHAAHATGASVLAGLAAAVVLGAPLAATALTGGLPGAVLGGVLLAVTAGAQMLTQHLSAGAAEMPGGRLLLLLPVVTAATGLVLPLAVTAYWACSALWTLAQQLVLPRSVRL